MRLRISQIPPQGSQLDFDIQPPALRDGLSSDDTLRQALTEAVKVSLLAEKLHENISLQGDYRATLTPNCDRCLESFSFSCNQPFHLTCLPISKVDEEDEGIYPYRGDIIDLAEIIRSQLFAQIPMTWHCQKDCKGLCQSCGENLNQRRCSCDSAATLN